MEISEMAVSGISEHVHKRVNWVLLVGLLGCLSFWSVVAFGILAAV